MRFIAAKNFEEFQHYGDRRTPPWIKLYNRLLDDYEFLQLSETMQRHLMLIWLVASRHKNRIPNDLSYIRRAIHVKGKLDLAPLFAAGFLTEVDEPASKDASTTLAPRYQDASKPLAEREQDASPRVRAHTRPRARETRREKEQERVSRSGESAAPKTFAPGRTPRRSLAVARATEEQRQALPPAAVEFGERFYGTASKERKVEIVDQLCALLNGGCPDDQGRIVKAGSPERLEAKARETIAEGVDNPNAAIVVLMRKCGDVSDDSPTERAANADRRVTRHDEQAHAQLAAAFQLEHPDEAAAIEQEVNAGYPDCEPGSFKDSVRLAAITAKLAASARALAGSGTP